MLTQIIVRPLALIHLISSWNIKMFNHSPAIVVVIGSYNAVAPSVFRLIQSKLHIILIIQLNICDRACDNQPCEHKMLRLLYHNLLTIDINTTKSFPLLQNLMGFLLQFK